MILDHNFIQKAIKFFNDPTIAGIGGNIFEKSTENLVFQVRSKHQKVNNVMEVNQLGMGGLYRRTAIDDVGYFSNPYFYAYEEYDLGAALREKGYKMVRIPERMIEHYGDETTSFETLKSKWKSKYLFGSGQYLRSSLTSWHFLKTVYELRIYVFTFFWFILGISSIFSLYWTNKLFMVYLIITGLIVVLLIIRKKSVNKLIFSFASWSLQSLGMCVGFLLKNRSPFDFKPSIKIIK